MVFLLLAFNTVGGRKARPYIIGKNENCRGGVYPRPQPGTSSALFHFLQKDSIKGYNRAKIKIDKARPTNHKRNQTLCLKQMNRQLLCRGLKSRNF